MTITTSEVFARIAFEAHWDARLGEGGREVWARLSDGERQLWFEAGEAIEKHVAASGASLSDLIRDMLQAFPDTADEQEWRDRAGALGVRDPDGKPYRAYTEEDL